MTTVAQPRTEQQLRFLRNLIADVLAGEVGVVPTQYHITDCLDVLDAYADGEVWIPESQAAEDECGYSYFSVLPICEKQPRSAHVNRSQFVQWMADQHRAGSNLPDASGDALPACPDGKHYLSSGGLMPSAAKVYEAARDAIDALPVIDPDRAACDDRIAWAIVANAPMDGGEASGAILGLLADCWDDLPWGYQTMPWEGGWTELVAIAERVWEGGAA